MYARVVAIATLCVLGGGGPLSLVPPLPAASFNSVKVKEEYLLGGGGGGLRERGIQGYSVGSRTLRTPRVYFFHDLYSIDDAQLILNLLGALAL